MVPGPPNAPHDAPVRIESNAQTVMANPQPPEVAAILAARQAHGNKHEVATAPSLTDFRQTANV